MRKKLFNQIAGIGLGLIGLLGCEDGVNENKSNYSVIEAKPLSVIYDGNIDDFSGFFEIDGRRILGKTDSSDRIAARDAAALIELRKNTGKPLQLYGCFKEKEGQRFFMIESVRDIETKYRFDIRDIHGNPYELEKEGR